MKDLKVTIASLKSILADPSENLNRVRSVCLTAEQAGARLLFLPELMLTGHGGHPKMYQNAEPVPDGPLCQEIIKLSARHNLCICVGMAELAHDLVYNSQIVVDQGKYLGLQRKINLSGDEYCFFAAGETIARFDIGDVRFGITICYDNHFPEIAVIHSLQHAELVLAPHAARIGTWPEVLSPEFCAGLIAKQQAAWEKVHRARAFDHNAFVLLNNAVGSATAGLENVIANHAGTVMGVDPAGDVFLRTAQTEIAEEVTTVELNGGLRNVNHNMTRNRRLLTVIEQFKAAM